MQFKIQNILLPDPIVCNETEMYLRSGDHIHVTKEKVEMDKWVTCAFSTYFNSFSLNKWKQHTRLVVLLHSGHCCFSGKSSYPFFIRMDDMQYSIRNTDTIITLNGISVWHEAFDKKYSSTMENYFMFRNNLVVNFVHGYGGLF